MYERTNDAISLRDYLGVFRRQLWLILFVAAITGTAGAVYYLHGKQTTYRATATASYSEGDVSTITTGTQSGGAKLDPVRIGMNQVQFAQTPGVAEQALGIAGVKKTPAATLLGETSISADPTADLITFSVADANPARAVKLANAYRDAFIAARRTTDEPLFNRALVQISNAIKRGATNDPTYYSSNSYTSLVTRRQSINVGRTAYFNAFKNIDDASSAASTRGGPGRYIALAWALGLILGILLAFLRDALDTRVRRSDEIARRIGLPQLGRLPEPARRLRRTNQIVMLADPQSPDAEAVRIMRTNIEFANLKSQAQILMVTSAVDGEGKTTTAANLAASLALGGKRVALVDLDLRRGGLSRLFGHGEAPGVTDAAVGHYELDEVVRPIPLGQHSAIGESGRVEGSLALLPCGTMPPDAAEFVESDALIDLLGLLRTRADVIVVDSPPILPVSDARSISQYVDGVLVVVHATLIRRPMLNDLADVLDAVPARKLGVVLTGIGAPAGYGYGTGTGGSARARETRETPRSRTTMETSV